MARALVATAHGGTDVLHVEERPDPTPAAGQVLVDVAAVGVIGMAGQNAAALAEPQVRQPLLDLGFEVVVRESA